MTSPITVTFSKPVYQLVVGIGGAFSCSGDYGTVTVYNRVGTQVEQRPFILTDPGDCGADNVTGFATDTLLFVGGIGSIAITPPQPWSFGVFGGTGYVTALYGYSFYEARPPNAPCPTGDELLDQQAMRDLLTAVWVASNPNSPPAMRRELRGFLFEDSTGNLVYQTYPDTTLNPPLDTLIDTPCASFGVPYALPGIPLASGHPHPYTPGDTLPNVACKLGLKPGWLSLYDIQRYGGPSKADIASISDWNVPLYLLDKINIYVAPLGTDTLNALTMVKHYPRLDPSGCTRP
jgi:hypothetical protein